MKDWTNIETQAEEKTIKLISLSSAEEEEHFRVLLCHQHSTNNPVLNSHLIYSFSTYLLSVHDVTETLLGTDNKPMSGQSL